MLLFTTTNAILVALLQVGVVCAAVLSAGLGRNLLDKASLPSSTPTLLLYHYGFWLLTLPLLWIAGAMWFKRNPKRSDSAKGAVFLLGLAVLLALFVLFVIGGVGAILTGLFATAEVAGGGEG